MPSPPLRSRWSKPSFLLWLLALPAFLAACGGDAESLDVGAEAVDRESSVSITEDEQDDFSPPRDGILTEDQVVGYLKTSLLQLDYIHKESGDWHDRLTRMEERQQEGGALGQLQNLVDAGRSMTQMSDMVGASYIRSARALGYNPAEMEWVRERMNEVANYLMMQPVYDQASQAAVQLRAQADEIRRQAVAEGMAADQIDEQLSYMLAAADEMESEQLVESTPPQVLKNLELLRRVRPAVTDDVWGAVGFAGGSAGLVVLSGFADPRDAEAQKAIEQFRQAFQNALNNRPGKGKQGGQ